MTTRLVRQASIEHGLPWHNFSTYHTMHNLLLILSLIFNLSHQIDPKQDDYELFKNVSDYWRITYIVDGDTFHGINTEGEKRKFRPIGINTLETGKRNGRPEPFHQEATDFTTAMLMDQTVRIVYDVTELDRYGRHLVYVYLQDGTFFNLEIVRAGWARTMTIAPNVKYAELFSEAQREAREQGRGSWE